MEKTVKRNQFIDIMRGIAMLLVVLGHTMTGCTVDSQKSFLFNVVWSLQMPLFILISGYVTKYSRSICDGKGLWKYVKRRTIAYMIPWAVWSFLVRGVIFGQDGFLNIKSLLWNMDSGYWFLATIWTISIIFGVASYLAERIGKSNAVKKQIALFGFYLLGMILLVGIGMVVGLSFFAIKLTLYYMPFYYAGYLYGQIDDKLLSTDKGKKIVDCCVALCFAIWFFIILRFSLYEMSDSGLAIILRAATSLAGCIAVCGLCNGIFSDKIGGGYGLDRRTLSGSLPRTLSAAKSDQTGKQSVILQSNGTDTGFGELPVDGVACSADYRSNKQEQDIKGRTDGKERLSAFLLWAGKRSLEIYMIHGLLLNIFRSSELVPFTSIQGYLLTTGNFALTVGLCALVIELLNQNRSLKKVLNIR